MEGALRVFPTADELAAAAADEVVRRAQQAVAVRGRFSLVLAGGSTPLALYRLLAERATDPGVPWAAIDWFWSDERAVPPDNPASNFGAAWGALLSKLPIPAQRIHRIEAELAPEVAASRYEQEIRRTLALDAEQDLRFDLARFDLVLLGLGTDGHTASLFPGCSALGELERAVAATWIEGLESHRITLTYPALNAAAAVLFLVAGEEKAEILEQVLEGPRAVERLPAQGVAPSQGELLWWVDRAASHRVARRPL